MKMQSKGLSELTSTRTTVVLVNFARWLMFALAVPFTTYRLPFFDLTHGYALVYPLVSLFITAETTRNFERGEELLRRTDYACILLLLSFLTNAVVTGLFVYELWEGIYTRDWMLHVYCTVLSGTSTAFDAVLWRCLRDYHDALSWLTKDGKTKND